jgi:hypothetical protein
MHMHVLVPIAPHEHACINTVMRIGMHYIMHTYSMHTHVHTHLNNP